MPLIVICGLPQSGKTTIANALARRIPDAITVADTLPRDAYADSHLERRNRNELLSRVKRTLTASTTVILDSANYIKGFRYQLYCEAARLLNDRYCVVHALASRDQCNDRNASTGAWDASLLDEMCMRFEEPSNLARWDSPLFEVWSSDEIDPIIDHIQGKTHLPKDSQAASPTSIAPLKTAPARPPNYLQVLDHETSTVITKIKSQLATPQGLPPGRFILHGTDVDDPDCYFLEVPAGVRVDVAKLQRFKRQFIALNKLRQLETHRVAALFADYINKHLQE